MNTKTQKSLKALEELFAELGRAKIEEIANSIDNTKYDGPTVEEFINNFDSQYSHAISISLMDMNSLENVWDCNELYRIKDINVMLLDKNIPLSTPAIITSSITIAKLNPGKDLGQQYIGINEFLLEAA